MISKNLTEIPSTGTYSDKEHKPVTAIEFESWIEDNNIIGYVTTNSANPGFYESSENLSPSDIHQELYTPINRNLDFKWVFKICSRRNISNGMGATTNRSRPI